MRRMQTVCALAVGFLLTGTAAAQIDVIGGQTNVALDTTALADLASLELSSVSGDVIVPGTLPDSVAFPINSRTASAPALPTTFSYEAGLASFSGTIEHTGTVRFNSDTVEVGNFTIGYDAARAGTLGGNASGFFVQDTFSLGAILFDVETPTALTATSDTLSITADLLVSPEFGQFLFDNDLSDTNLQGADVGDALVAANSIPEPGSAALLALGATLFGLRRRG